MASKTDLSGSLAVVTGASSGIGLCFCRTLASMGCSLVMVSNQTPQLEECAAEIHSAFGVATHPLFCDLTAPDCVETVMDFLDTHALQPDILINNAGIFSFLPVTDTPRRKIDCFIRLHIDAVTNLSRAFALRFASRETAHNSGKKIPRGSKGRILNMSSMSCWMPMPGIALYSATKAYIRVFTRALHYEMRDAGVSVTVACPGGIATDLFGLPKNLQRLAVRIGAIQTPEKFTRKAIGRMLKGRRQYINGFLNRLTILFIGLAPTPLRMQVKRRLLDQGITR